MSNLLLSLFKKRQCQWFAHDSWITLKQRAIPSLKNLFFICFWQFFPLFMTKEQISPVTLCSVALFLKIDGIDSLSLLFTKERREQIAPDALKKRAMWVICSWFERITRKNRAICSKNSNCLNVFDKFLHFMPKSESLPALF